MPTPLRMWRELPSWSNAGWSLPPITSIGPDWVAMRMSGEGFQLALVTTSARPSRRTWNTPLGIRWKLPPPLRRLIARTCWPSTIARPIGRPSSPNMPAFIAKATCAARLPRLASRSAKRRTGVLVARRGDQLDPPVAGSQTVKRLAFELLLRARSRARYGSCAAALESASPQATSRRRKSRSALRIAAKLAPQAAVSMPSSPSLR